MPSEQFERDKVCYQQNCESFRSLNAMMWQVPIIAMTLTGGLWYGVTTGTLDDWMKSILLLFAGIGNIGLILVINRVRSVMEAYLERMRTFSELGAAAPEERRGFWQKNRGVCRTMSALMGMGAILSVIGSVYFFFIQDAP